MEYFEAMNLLATWAIDGPHHTSLLLESETPLGYPLVRLSARTVPSYLYISNFCDHAVEGRATFKQYCYLLIFLQMAFSKSVSFLCMPQFKDDM